MRNVARAALLIVFALALNAAPYAQDKSAASAKPALNLNTATLDQLQELPGVGKATAERILEYRQKAGGFKRVEEILEFQRLAPCLLTISVSNVRRADRTSLRKSPEISRSLTLGGRNGGRTK